MRHKSISLLALPLSCLVLFSSCATLFTKSKQEVSFKGIPGTEVIDKKNDQRIAEVGPNGFATALISKKLKKKELQAKKEGYKPRDFTLDTKIQGAFWGNLVLGGVIGMAIDVATGKMMKYSTEMLDITLMPDEKTLAQTDTLLIVNEPPVSRDNPGATELEKTILRWYIDSDPRGARVFYRVISNVPSEVANTNEAYLTTTPIEETRSFNIPGLTYENANNVTVEIKVSKRGYTDQVKRYNVRQALDQREISGFFELVEK